jgi:hypothetical protein
VVLEGDEQEWWYRVDDEGRIFVLSETGQERLWLDATPSPDPSAVLRIVATDQVYSGPVGTLPHAIRFQAAISSLNFVTGTFARGVGLVRQRTNLMAGSSGGFLEGLELVYARLGGTTVLSAPELAFGLSVERTVLSLTPGNVTNCAVPCYFVACGLVPATDPPGTFKPCLRTRIILRSTGEDPVTLSFPSGQIFDLELTNEGGRVVYRRSDTMTIDPMPLTQTYGPGETNYWQQVPLYVRPNEPLPAGRYTLTGTVVPVDGQGFSASVPLLIQ